MEASVTQRHHLPARNTVRTNRVTHSGLLVGAATRRGRGDRTRAHLRPGVTVTGGWTGTADGLLALLASLEEVPSDDPRIAEHALDEEHGG